MKAITKIIFLDDEGKKFFGEGPARLMHAIEEKDSLERMEQLLCQVYGKVSLQRCQNHQGKARLVMLSEEEEDESDNENHLFGR